MTDRFPTDPLAEWTSHAKARDGADICIRPLHPNDRVREIAFINSLSERTRYLRLMAPLRFLPPHLLNQFMDIDYHARMALVASVDNDGVEEFIGVARYGPTDDPTTVEMAVTVTDAWQRQGVARLLVAQLMKYAARRGFTGMCGFVLTENHRMLALAHSLGFEAHYDSAEHLIHIRRELARAPYVDKV
ncbi:MAG: GNAT family N-acetyltransferase [Lysobacterales bacterium]|nr:MAG: GNAT family N-acetyltransferase [Xanthomonadales bacterium]